jgi:DNA-directed RNA polymerase subunit RPC12/RpoP
MIQRCEKCHADYDDTDNWKDKLPKLVCPACGYLIGSSYKYDEERAVKK